MSTLQALEIVLNDTKYPRHQVVEARAALRAWLKEQT